MKVSIEIERKFYKAKLEFDNEEDNIERQIEDTLERIDSKIQDSTKIWHIDVPEFMKGLMEILPNGTTRFHPEMRSQIDQLVCATAVGGRGGISSAEAAQLIDIPQTSATGYFQNEAYKQWFKQTDDGSYRLSKEGLDKLQEIVEK